MKPKVLFIFTLVGIIGIWGGCCYDVFYVTRTRFSLHNLNNVGKCPFIITEPSIRANVYGFLMDIQDSSDNYAFIPKLQLFSAAYATSCDNPHFSFSEQVEDITILSIQTFDNLHPAGSSINDYFDARTVSFDTVLHCATVATTDIPAITNMMNQPEQRNLLDYEFFLNRTPHTAGVFNFIVKLRLSDGRTLQDTTPSIYLY